MVNRRKIQEEKSRNQGPILLAIPVDITVHANSVIVSRRHWDQRRKMSHESEESDKSSLKSPATHVVFPISISFCVL